jgi:hypothetical protein
MMKKKGNIIYFFKNEKIKFFMLVKGLLVDPSSIHIVIDMAFFAISF